MAHQTLPGIFVQEAHCDIESRASPAFQAVRICKGVARLLGDVDHIDCAQPCGKERLVCVTPCGVHDECTGVLADGFGKRLGTMLHDDVTPTHFTGQRRIQGRTVDGILPVLELGDDDLVLEARFSYLSLDGATVHREITEVCK